MTQPIFICFLFQKSNPYVNVHMYFPSMESCQDMGGSTLASLPSIGSGIRLGLGWRWSRLIISVQNKLDNALCKINTANLKS